MELPGIFKEFIFGTLLSNVILIGGFFRFAWHLYKRYNVLMNQHRIMWQAHLIRNPNPNLGLGLSPKSELSQYSGSSTNSEIKT